MHRFEANDLTPSLPASPEPSQDISTSSTCDWRGWIVLAWALWFGLLYGKMVMESRGHQVRALVQAPNIPSPR